MRYCSLLVIDGAKKERNYGVLVVFVNIDMRGFRIHGDVRFSRVVFKDKTYHSSPHG